jgi:hypothetical protein
MCPAGFGGYFRIYRMANTSVEKIKQPRAKFQSVFLEIVI